MTVNLSGQDLLLDIYWCPGPERWCVDAFLDGAPLHRGRQIALGQPLIAHVDFEGALIVTRYDGGGSDPIPRNAWTDEPRHILQYYGPMRNGSAA